MTIAGRSWKRWLPAVIVPVALFIGLASWGLSSPTGSSPDEDYHMASIWCAQGSRDGLCAPGTSSDTRVVPKELITAAQCFQFKPQHSGSCKAYPSSVMVLTDRGNFNGNSYPPLYYLTLSVFASAHIGVSVIAMRIFNALLFVALVTTLFFLVRRAHRGPLIWSGMAAIIPLGMFLVPSINPSGWSITSAILLWVALVSFFAETSVRRRVGLAVIASVATVMGAGARGDSAVYGGLAALVAVILSLERSKRFYRSLVLPVVLVIVDLAFFFTSGQSAIINPDTISTPSASFSSLFSLAEVDIPLLPQLWVGSFGTWGLGWLDTVMPDLVWVPVLGLFVSLIFWGLSRGGWRKNTAVWLVFGSLVLIPLYIVLHDNVIIGSYVQPRYIYPLLFLFLGVALIGFRRDDLGLNRAHLGFLMVALIIANSLALHTNIRRYVTGINVSGFNLSANVEWWWGLLPFGPLADWLIGSVSFGVALIGLALYARSSSRSLPTSRSALSPAPASIVD